MRGIVVVLLIALAVLAVAASSIASPLRGGCADGKCGVGAPDRVKALVSPKAKAPKLDQTIAAVAVSKHTASVRRPHVVSKAKEALRFIRPRR